MSVNRFDLVDQDDDADIEVSTGDTVAGQSVSQSFPGDTVTVNVPGLGNVTYTGITFYLADGSQVFTPTDGQVLQEGTLVGTTFVNTQAPLAVGDLGPTCFTPGVKLHTAKGPRAVEHLRPGDLVQTFDHGLQPVRAILLNRAQGKGAYAPVRIKAGALGNDADLVVSQQHRILVTGWRAELLFGEPEVLVAAKHLARCDQIRIEPCAKVSYLHVLFDRHELVWSNGILSESFFAAERVGDGPGPQADMLAKLSSVPRVAHRHLARPATRRYEGIQMVA